MLKVFGDPYSLSVKVPDILYWNVKLWSECKEWQISSQKQDSLGKVQKTEKSLRQNKIGGVYLT